MFRFLVVFAIVLGFGNVSFAQRAVEISESYKKFDFPENIYYITFTPDSRHLLASVKDEIRVINASTGRQAASLPHRHDEKTSTLYASFSSDGKYLAVNFDSMHGAHVMMNKIRIWEIADIKDPATWKTLHDIMVPVNSNIFSFSKDGRLIVCVKPSVVRVYNVLDGELQEEFKDTATSEADYRTYNMFLSDDNKLITVNTDGIIRIWNLESGIAKHFAPNLNSWRGDWSSDGSVMALSFGKGRMPGSVDSGVATWLRKQTGSKPSINTVILFNKEDNSVSALRNPRMPTAFLFAPSENDIETSDEGTGYSYAEGIMAIAAEDRKVYLWNYKEGKLLAILSGHGPAPQPSHLTKIGVISFSRNGKWLATAGGQDRKVHLWSIEDITKKISKK